MHNKLFLNDQSKLARRLLTQPPGQFTLAPEQGRYGYRDMIKYFAVSVLLFLQPSILLACSYVLPSLNELYAETDVIFTGKLIESRHSVWQERQPSNTGTSITFGSSPSISVLKVLEVIKGDSQNPEALNEGKIVYVIQDVSSCMMSTTVDEEYLIFGTKALRRTYTTNQSSGSEPVNNAQEIISELRELAQ